MTDALWNGIIGAGGAAICCAVYFGYKAIKKSISKIKVNKSQPMVKEMEQSNVALSNNNSTQSKSKTISITIPTFKQIFSRTNIRAIGFIILAIICFVAIDDVRVDYRVTDGYSLTFEGDYYTNVSDNLQNIACNTRAFNYLVEQIADYFFGILGGLFALIGITSFKIKS